MIPRLIILFGILQIISCTSIRKTSSPAIPYTSERFLIITAEDFGASQNINEGIEIAADQKVITSISVLSNFSESLPELKQISERHPDIDIGVHLNIFTGKPVLDAEEVPSLVNNAGNFYTIEEFLPKIKNISPDDLRRELRAQILALTKYNIRPDHLSDQHGILSLYSPFFDIILELAKEFNVPVRTPVLASVKYPDLFPDSHMYRRGKQISLRFALNHPFRAVRFLKYGRMNEIERKVQKMNELGILHPDLLIETFWGDPSKKNYLNIIEHLPAGISELIIHVGTNTRQESYPSGLDLDYFKNRELELMTVTDEYIKKHYNHLNIKIIGYSAIIDH